MFQFAKPPLWLQTLAATLLISLIVGGLLVATQTTPIVKVRAAADPSFSLTDPATSAVFTVTPRSLEKHAGNIINIGTLDITETKNGKTTDIGNISGTVNAYQSGSTFYSTDNFTGTGTLYNLANQLTGTGQVHFPVDDPDFKASAVGKTLVSKGDALTLSTESPWGDETIAVTSCNHDYQRRFQKCGELGVSHSNKKVTDLGLGTPADNAFDQAVTGETTNYNRLLGMTASASPVNNGVYLAAFTQSQKQDRAMFWPAAAFIVGMIGVVTGSLMENVCGKAALCPGMSPETWATVGAIVTRLGTGVTSLSGYAVLAPIVDNAISGIAQGVAIGRAVYDWADGNGSAKNVAQTVVTAAQQQFGLTFPDLAMKVVGLAAQPLSPGAAV